MVGTEMGWGHDFFKSPAFEKVNIYKIDEKNFGLLRVIAPRISVQTAPTTQLQVPKIHNNPEEPKVSFVNFVDVNFLKCWRLNKS